MAQIDDARLQELANVLVDASVQLRHDPSDMQAHIGRLKQAVEDIEAIESHYLTEMHQPFRP